MSYILEALRRADRERDGGKPPGIESLADAVERARAQAPLRIWALGAATLLVAFAALLVALLRQPTPIIINVPAATAPVPASTAAAAAPAPATITIVTPNGSTLERSGDEIPSGESANAGDFDDTGSPIAEPEPSADASTSSSRKKADKARPRSKTLARTADSSSQASVSASPAAPAATRLQDMPDSYRAQFPSTTLDVHVYDDDPSRRWIMVDGKRYHEGETLGNGAHINAIGADSVTYDYNGAQVAVPVR